MRRLRPTRAGLTLGLAAAATLLALSGCGTADSTPSPRFHNRDGTAIEPEGFWRWQWQRWRDGLPKPPTRTLAPVAPAVEAIRARQGGAALTWIGHASVLLQLDGLNVLADPIFSERASPLSFLGPKRHQPPGLTLAQLPRIDVVLVSHNHYDHLDLDSVRALMQQAGGPPRFLVPRGVERWFAEAVPGTRLDGPDANVRGFDWDEVLSLPGRSGPVDFRFLAVQHWSSRTPWDRNETLWGSWAVLHPRFRFWFSGDLGYSGDTAAIGRTWGPFDAAAIAIGAYEPRWFMEAQHINPAEAVQIANELGVRHAIGVHWGTFELTDESLDQPPKDLAAAVAAQGWPADRFSVLRHGETCVWKDRLEAR